MGMGKKAIVGIGCIIVGLIIALGLLTCTERIPAGYVGVVYSMSGGVQDEVLTQGWHVVSPTKKVTRYSIATEQLYMNKDGNEDSSFDVICLDGKMNVDLEMSYSFDADEVTAVYKKYRGLSGEEVVNSIVKGKIKTKVSEVTSQYSVLEAYMEKKAQLNKDITAALQSYLKEFGVTV
ncbi:MAG: prohibitin family protein, partial [Bacilli bacterium]|nr:prohibitin family protein [Bacilli bacterium]